MGSVEKVNIGLPGKPYVVRRYIGYRNLSPKQRDETGVTAMVTPVSYSSKPGFALKNAPFEAPLRASPLIDSQLFHRGIGEDAEFFEVVLIGPGVALGAEGVGADPVAFRV